MKIEEARCPQLYADALLALSAAWAEEGSCRGYQKNEPDDLKGCRVFLAWEDENLIGYLLCREGKTAAASSVAPSGTPYVEVDEIYVQPAFRCQGIGKALFQAMEHQIKCEGSASCIFLTAAAKNSRAILHFYLDELGMEFWYARLFKTLD